MDETQQFILNAGSTQICFYILQPNYMKIELKNSVRRLTFLCCQLDIKVAWISPCLWKRLPEGSGSSKLCFLLYKTILLHASETVSPCYLCMKWQLCYHIDPRMFRMFPVVMLNFQTKKYSFQFWVIYVIERLKNFQTIIKVIDAKVVY